MVQALPNPCLFYASTQLMRAVKWGTTILNFMKTILKYGKKYLRKEQGVEAHKEWTYRNIWCIQLTCPRLILKVDIIFYWQQSIMIWKFIRIEHPRYVVNTLHIEYTRYIKPSLHNFEICLPPWFVSESCLGRLLVAWLATGSLRDKSWKETIFKISVEQFNLYVCNGVVND